MESVRRLVKSVTDKVLFQAWEENTEDMSNIAIAVNAIIETELENRGLIKLNEETMEYEIVRKG